MQIIKTGQQIGTTIRNAGRMRAIVGVFVRHGFYNLAERINLGRFVLERLNSRGDIDKYSTAERVRMSFEELGPTFVKLGQLLASRPDLVPEAFVTEFSKLHDNVQPLSFETVQQVLRQEFGAELDRQFASFDSQPLGSASIAQVHLAKLQDGQQVVVKVQRPGIMNIISDDLNVLYFLAELIEKYVPELRVFNPVGIVNEFFKTLELETNFVVEANNLRRFKDNFKNEAYVHIPKVYFNLTTARVLTMEALAGIPLSQPKSLQQPDMDRDEVIRRGLRAYLQMVFVHGLFHGDLHPGNFFVMPNNEIGFVDFGVVGRLNERTRTSITAMLYALSKEDYDQVAYEFVDLAPFNERVNLDLFAKELRDLLAPYYGLTLQNVNLGRILLNAGSIAARHGVGVPTELMLFFKSIVAIEGMGQRLRPDFDFLNYSLEFAGELMRVQYDPQKVMGELTHFARDSKTLVHGLPRQLNFVFRRWNSPNYASKLHIDNLPQLQNTVEKSFRLLFLAILISALVFSGAYVLVQPTTTTIAGIASFSFVCFASAFVLAMFAAYNYFRK